MSIRNRTRSLLCLAAVVATTVSAIPAAAVVAPGVAQHWPGAGIARVESGWLRGAVADDHVTYSAVPYAAPPVAERRWRPPQRARHWWGLRDATRPSPLCPQSGQVEGAIIGQEDCLFVDVTVPRGVRQPARLPVLVWLHGGNFDSGGAQRFDAARLATQGEMAVVTVNYRLGALGFLSSPELDRTGGNYGLMDQAAALGWVRRNAAAFGADPHNVTLAGQSAGARAVCAQLASPISRGLFDRAIMQSGACDNAVLTRPAARDFGVRAIRKLGCDTAPDVAACLRRRSPAALVGTLARVGFELNGRAADRPWNPVASTAVLPRQPSTALRTGTAARVPLLLGGNRDEMRGFVSWMAANVTEQTYRTMLKQTFGGQADAVLRKYPVAAFDSPALALATVLGDWGGRIGVCPVLRTAEAAAAHQPVYAYEFTADSNQVVGDYPLGSYHGLELPYLWTLNGQNPYPPLTPRQQRLSKTMIDYWSAFVRTGTPNGAGRPRWQAFPATGTVIELSTEGIAPTPSARNHRCGFWAGLPR